MESLVVKCACLSYPIPTISVEHEKSHKADGEPDEEEAVVQVHREGDPPVASEGFH